MMPFLRGTALPWWAESGAHMRDATSLRHMIRMVESERADMTELRACLEDAPDLQAEIDADIERADALLAEMKARLDEVLEVRP